MWRAVLGGLIAFRCATGLQQDEQIRVLNPRDNPPVPSQKFLESLARGRRTLLLVGDAEPRSGHKPLLDYLQKRNHKVTVSSQLDGLVADGAYTHDSVVITGNADVTKINLNRLLKFIDVRWVLPRSYDEQFKSEMRGLELPPSLLFFGNVSRTLLSEFGLEEVRAEIEKQSVQVQANPFKLTSLSSADSMREPLLRRAFDSSFSQAVEVIASPTATDPIWRGAVIQGDISWARSVIAPASRCQEQPTACENLLDWAFHRTHVRTWSNLQHRRIQTGREFDEFSGAPRTSPYTKKEFELIKTEFDQSYKVWDELFVSVDMHDLREKPAGKFSWQPAESLDYYGSFEMVVPYWRKRLVMFGVPSQKSTELIQAVQKHLRVPADTRFGNITRAASLITHFKAPKQHGVYKFVIRPVAPAASVPITPVWLETLIPMRTYLHDEEQPRGIYSAYPYYLSVFIMTLAPVLILLDRMTLRPKG